jgi:hypothetical protein
LNDEEFSHLEALAHNAGLKPNAMARVLTIRPAHDVPVAQYQRMDPALVNWFQSVGSQLTGLVSAARSNNIALPLVEKLCTEIGNIVLAEVEKVIK